MLDVHHITLELGLVVLIRIMIANLPGIFPLSPP